MDSANRTKPLQEGETVNSSRRIDKTVNRSLWLIVLGVILSVSAYSFYVIARKLGVPPLIAIGISTCFDGTALLAANYSVRYTAEGLSGSFPRTVVRITAVLTAYIQTFHAITKDGYGKSWIIWASLPLAAMAVYEIHIRWAKRKALVSAGVPFPVPLPPFGFITWCLYPRSTFHALREVIARRRDAMLTDALTRAAIVSSVYQLDSEKPDSVNRSSAKRIPQKRSIPAHANPSGHRDAPVLHIRQWAKQHGYDIGDRGRLSPYIISEYESAMAS